MEAKVVPWWWNPISLESKNDAVEAISQNRFTSGPSVELLEEALSKEFKSFCAVVNSGTSSIFASLVELGIGPGDEVLVPSLTWIATAHAVMMTGASPVLVDVNPTSLVIHPKQLKKRISKKTKAVVHVNFNGKRMTSEVAEVYAEICRDRQIEVIEDSCKALATELLSSPNTLSRTQCFSMGMISYISVGYGGFVLSQDLDLIKRIKLIRDHGVYRGSQEEYRLIGGNLKISDILASLALAQIPRIRERIADTKQTINRYKGQILTDNFKILDYGEDCIPTYIQAVCKSKEIRDFTISKLMEYGIEVIKYHEPLSRVPYLKKLPRNRNLKFTIAENVADRLLTLPSGFDLDVESIRVVCEKLNEIGENFD